MHAWSTKAGSGERDYHYGATPQGLLELRLVLDDRDMLIVTGHEYYVSGVGSTEDRGSENIARGTTSFTVRVYDRPAIAFRYVTSQRDAHYPDLPRTYQSVETFYLAYTFLGSTGFGAVECLGEAMSHEDKDSCAERQLAKANVCENGECVIESTTSQNNNDVLLQKK